MAAPKTQRMLRLAISLYNGETKTAKECHEFATLDHAIKAAPLHVEHNIQQYQQAFSPPSLRGLAEAMKTGGRNAWVIDDHDVTVEFYFKDLAAVNSIGADPRWKELQREEGPFVSGKHPVVSLSWVECYVLDGKVVNLHDGKPTYGSFDESSHIEMPAPPQQQ